MQMMTRMLKKKIHPELECKKQIKKENKIKYGGNGVIEMASLLHTQGMLISFLLFQSNTTRAHAYITNSDLVSHFS